MNIAANKFADCISDIKEVSRDEQEGKEILIPASSSLYIPGKIKDNKKFLVDIGTGYYVEKEAADAIVFYTQKIEKLKKESVQIQEIIKDKTTASLALEQRLRAAAVAAHEQAKEADAAKAK